jgi:toxin ParE1/3/4
MKRDVWEVIYLEEANTDLENIYDYIDEKLVEPMIAANQARRIIDAIDGLVPMIIWHRLFEHEPWKSRGFRVMPVDNFSVFYVADEDKAVVTIVAIMYSKRDFRRHLKSPDEYEM